MNDALAAILNGALGQISALSSTTRSSIDAGTADVATQTANAAAAAAAAQAAIDADNASIEENRAALSVQESVAQALTNALAMLNAPPAPAPEPDAVPV